MAIRAPAGAKNSHILPTGQWYAPSAVINDALIMPEYARACQSIPEYARVCQRWLIELLTELTMLKVCVEISFSIFKSS